MKTRTNTIAESNSKNKSSEYLALANELLLDAQETAQETGNFFVSKIADEIKTLFNKVKTADCEYTAYANCNALEIWHNQIQSNF